MTNKIYKIIGRLTVIFYKEKKTYIQVEERNVFSLDTLLN